MTTHEKFMDNLVEVGGIDPNSQEFRRWLASGYAAGKDGFISLDENGTAVGDGSTSAKAERIQNSLRQMLRSTIASLNAELGSLVNKMDGLRQNLADTRQEIADTEKFIADTELNISDLEQKAEDESETRDEAQEELRTTQEELDRLRQTDNDLESFARHGGPIVQQNLAMHRAEIRAQMEALTETQEKLHEIIRASEFKIEDYQEALTEQRAALSEARARLETLEANEDRIESEIEAVQSEITMIEQQLEVMTHPQLVKGIENGDANTWGEAIDLLPENMQNFANETIKTLSGNAEWLADNFGDNETITQIAEEAYEIASGIYETATDTLDTIGETAQQFLGSTIWNNQWFQQDVETPETPSNLAGTDSINGSFAAAHDHAYADHQTIYQATRTVTWQPGATIA